MFEAAGKHVFPAFVDPHVHLRTPEQEYKERPGLGDGRRRGRRLLRGDRHAQYRPGGGAGAQILGSLTGRARREARVPVGFLGAITRGLAGH